MINDNFPIGIVPVDLLVPATDAGGRASLCVNLKNAQKAFVVVYMDQGAANTVAVTLAQAATAAGATKAVTNNCQIFTNEDMAAATAFTRQTDAKTFTTSAATKHKCIVFVVRPEALDLASNYTHIGVTTGASNASNITSAMVYIMPRYADPASASISYVA